MVTQAAPEFDLPALTGDGARLSELLAAGPVLLAFFKVTCPTCQLTMPFLERLHKGGNEGAPRVIGISQDDARATGDFNRRFGVTFTMLLDAREERYPVSNAYGITNVPTLFLVETDRRITQSVAGFEKAVLEKLGQRFGVEIFTSADRVPVFQPG